ncbi:unnamed protein product [Chrysoparadoxa australica]
MRSPAHLAAALWGPVKDPGDGVRVRGSRKAKPLSLDYNLHLERAEKEMERRKSKDLWRKCHRIQTQKQCFRERREANYAKELDIGTAQRKAPAASPAPPEGAPRPRPRPRRVQVKDSRYWRRTGFLWSDLYHTPKSRLGLVVTPLTVARERELMAVLELRAKEAEELDEKGKQMVAERVEAMRQKFRAKAVQSSQGRCITTPTAKSTKPCSARLQSLSQPSGRHKTARCASAPAPDTKGLLCTDAALREALLSTRLGAAYTWPWHEEERRRRGEGREGELAARVEERREQEALMDKPQPTPRVIRPGDFQTVCTLPSDDYTIVTAPYEAEVPEEDELEKGEEEHSREQLPGVS